MGPPVFKFDLIYTIEIAMKHYESETTHFLTQLKTERPYLEPAQQKGRSLLWDKQLDRKEQSDFKAAQVPQNPYVYQTS